jgi:ATP-dependent Lhr-like helicase
MPHLPVVGRWSALGEEDTLAADARQEARAHLLLARYGVVARELCRTEWTALRHALLRMELGGEIVRGYFVEGLSGEQYALADALPDLERAPHRAEGRVTDGHMILNITDPANLWGSVFALTRGNGTRVAVPRMPQAWLVFRGGRPVLLAERHGQDLTPLAAWEAADFPGAVRALQGLVERPPALRPVRRLDVATWDARPVHGSDAHPALLAAGFVDEADRAVYAYPSPA